MPASDDENYLNREQHFADAGIYRISEKQALVQTVDFFTPIVDDPYIFGQIAAANALSDVYAMGGKPLTVLNIICFPLSCQPLQVMEDILRGGYDKIIEAGATLVGGHSIEDSEPKYGLSVTGLVDIDQAATGSGALPGDLLVLTKPLGTGIIATAIKGEMVAESDAAFVSSGMAALNAAAAEAMVECRCRACTDITGFGFLGHLHEMLVSSGVSAEIEFASAPLYPAVQEMVALGMIPGGAYRNLEYVRPQINWHGAPDQKNDALIILADPQTSGGLLMAVTPDRHEDLFSAFRRRGVEAKVVGRVTAAEPGTMLIR